MTDLNPIAFQFPRGDFGFLKAIGDDRTLSRDEVGFNPLAGILVF